MPPKRPSDCGRLDRSMRRDLANLQKLVDEGAHVFDISTGLFANKEALLLAVIDKKNVEVLELLLANGVSPDFDDETIACHGNRHPVCEAIRTNDFAVIECLLEYGASVDRLKSRFGPNQAMLAAINYIDNAQLRYKVIRLLLYYRTSKVDKHGIDYTLPLHEAILRRDVDTCKLLIDSGADFEYMNFEFMGNALCSSILCNLPEVAKALIDKGTDTEIVDGDESPAILIAIKAGKPDMVKFLISYDKSNSVKNEKYLLELTVVHGTCSMLETLTECIGIDPNSDNGRVAFLDMILGGKLDMMRYFFKIGFDINYKTGGRSPLNIATTYNANFGCDVVKVLIKRIALMLAQGMPVDEGDVETIRSRKWSRNFLEKCRVELEQMKRTKLTPNCEMTYFDVLTISDEPLMKFLRTKGTWNWGFKIHKEELRERFTKISLRLLKIELFEITLERIFGKILPSDIIEKLSEYYNDAEFGNCI